MKKGLIKKSLRYSYLDGVFASAMTGFSEQFIIPYCLALSGTSWHVAFIATLPAFIGSLSQLISSEVIEKVKSRKKIINIFVFLHAIMWIPIILIPYLFNKSLILLIIFTTIYISLNSFCMPAWSSLMSEHIPSRKRGKYFGWRNKTLGLLNVSMGFVAGCILWLFKENKVWGFSVIFTMAFISRLISWYFLRKMYEPKYKHKPEAKFTFLDFIKRIKESNFGKFVFIVGMMSFSVNVASPFFGVYMLRDLTFNYIAYIIVIISATVTTFFMMEAWGKIGDLVGNIKIIRICSIFIPFIPVLWLFSNNIVYLILIQIFSGFFWAGFNISVSNFIYDAVTPAKRSRCIAYFNVVNGTSIFLGAVLGGKLALILPAFNGYKLLTLFLVSGILRIIPAGLSFIIKEVRPVHKMRNREIFYYITGFRPDSINKPID